MKKRELKIGTVNGFQSCMPWLSGLSWKVIAEGIGWEVTEHSSCASSSR